MYVNPGYFRSSSRTVGQTLSEGVHANRNMSPIRNSTNSKMGISTATCVSNSPRSTPIRSISTPTHRTNVTDTSASSMYYHRVESKYSG